MYDQPIYLPLGSLAAHTQAGQQGFRQKDVRFFSELFSNWVHVGGAGVIYALHNTQVARYMTDLVADARARRLGRSTPPRYRLTRAGMFRVLAEVTQRSYLAEPRESHLVWYFLRSYAPQIRRIVTAVGSDFSRAHALELDTLLDLKSFLTRQLQFADNEVSRLRARIDATLALHREVALMRARGSSMEDCARHVARAYPYELNAQKSFDELLLTIPEDVMEWELTDGATLRAEFVFRPIMAGIENHREFLKQLLEEVRQAQIK